MPLSHTGWYLEFNIYSDMHSLMPNPLYTPTHIVKYKKTCHNTTHERTTIYQFAILNGLIETHLKGGAIDLPNPTL